VAPSQPDCMAGSTTKAPSWRLPPTCRSGRSTWYAAR
jgi:hypothetical protein